ncbi:hypothetical protein BKA61DRAFT_707852 [Leptodontidium sp. MPI-SDFR-AT-0119]|nr:hypothetical protein BKA61DRAFT_707852 [Leptodontidium sp. MPI-SDFR-AT-0119]
MEVIQTASICAQPTAAITSQADSTQYASCSTISGSVVIGSSASSAISLDGPQQIKDFNLFNLTLLSTLQMSTLTTVKTFTWVALPALPSLSFGGPVSKADSVTVSSTFLSTLSGINLNTVSTLQIDNNNNLRRFDSQIANITNSLNINANGKLLAVTFPSLIWAANMTFRNISSIKIPSLATVNGSLGFYGNYMDNIAAPNLTSVGNFATGIGSLAFVANSKLANTSFPVLKSLGGADQIANNTDLNATSFPALTSVGGAIDSSGNFTTPELPRLESIKGAQSGGKGSVIQGTFICKTTETTSTLDGSSSTTGTGSSASSTSTKGAAVLYGVSEMAVGLSVVGGLL